MSEQLAQLIIDNNLTAEANAAVVSGDWSAVDSVINTKSIKQTDSRRKLMDDLIDEVGAANANLILASIKKAGRDEIPGVPDQLAESEWHNLSGVGSDLSRPGIQAFIGGLAAADGWPEGLHTQVKEMGVWYVSPAEEKGLGTPTIDEQKAAWAEKQISDRITNATALAEERILPLMTGTERAAAWAQAWEDAV